MKNWTRTYCRACGFETIAHRRRCFAGHYPVSAEEAQIQIKEVRHRRTPRLKTRTVVVEGAPVAPSAEQGILIIEEE